MATAESSSDLRPIRVGSHDRSKANLLRFQKRLSTIASAERHVVYGSALVLVLTNKCNIRCRHCLSGCSPLGEKTLSWSSVSSVIQQAHALQIKEVSITGGEPFLDLDELALIGALCESLGLEATVVSNGYWARTVSEAKNVLRGIPGLTCLALSTDSFHQEFISVQRIRNAIVACAELGISCMVGVSYLNEPLREVATVRRQLRTVPDTYTLQAQPVLAAGRAVTEVNQAELFFCEPTLSSCRNADSHSVSVDGVVFACCGLSEAWPGQHAFRLGSIREQSLEDILAAADRNPILQALRVWGVAGLLRIVEAQARREGHTLVPPPMNGMCSLCEYLITNPEPAELLRRGTEGLEMQHKIAVARVINHGEVSMLLALEGREPTEVTSR